MRLQCAKCGNEREIEDSELDFECVCIDPNRIKGTEKTYEAALEFDCDRCGNHITFATTFWEYPLLSLNQSKCDFEGCRILQLPDYPSYIHP